MMNIMSRTSKNTRVGMNVRCLFFASLCCGALVNANDVIESYQNNKVEFKTEAPTDLSPEAPKNCYEYLYGKLSAIRGHGSTWQNGGADCSNCTCDNGDIRCFFHFCSGPSTGYMTPPSTEDNAPMPLTGNAMPENRNEIPTAAEGADEGNEGGEGGGGDNEDEGNETEEEEESSGFRPQGLPDEEEEGQEGFPGALVGPGGGAGEGAGAEWPHQIVPEKWHNELSTFETSSAPSVGKGGDGGGVFSLLTKGGEGERKDRTENETHDVLMPKAVFCRGKTCKKICPQGFKMDPLTGCWKCACKKCDPTQPSNCRSKCIFGYRYVIDAAGCPTCGCVWPTSSGSSSSGSSSITSTSTRTSPTTSNDGDIVFEEDERYATDFLHDEEGEEGEREREHYGGV